MSSALKELLQLLSREHIQFNQYTVNIFTLHLLELVLRDDNSYIGYGRRLEERLQRHFHPEYADYTRDSLSGQQRMTAQLKEMVVNANLIKPQ